MNRALSLINARNSPQVTGSLCAASFGRSRVGLAPAHPKETRTQSRRKKAVTGSLPR